MGLSMDDVMVVLQIVKDLKDTELHVQTVDMTLSILKGDVGDSARGSLDFSGAACQARQAEPRAAPAAFPEAETTRHE